MVILSHELHKLLHIALNNDFVDTCNAFLVRLRKKYECDMVVTRILVGDSLDFPENFILLASLQETDDLREGSSF